MDIPVITLQDMFEAGCHFGHTTRRWNPKMRNFIFGERNGVHIIDLDKAVPMMNQALKALHDVAAGGGRILFVGTKHQAQEIIAETAKSAGQYYVNHRWLGGMLTNWKTITNSIKRLKALDEILAGEALGYTKKERLTLDRERTKLQATLGGIRDMAGLPDIIVVLDTLKESIAITEAAKLNIPVVAIIDSNSNPDGISYCIPGNDDAVRAIKLYFESFASAILVGLEKSLANAGVDLGAREKPTETVVDSAVAPETTPEIIAATKE